MDYSNRLQLPSHAVGFNSRTAYEEPVEKIDYSLYVTEVKPLKTAKKFTTTESLEQFLARGGSIGTPKNNFGKKPIAKEQAKIAPQDKSAAIEAWFKLYQNKR